MKLSVQESSLARVKANLRDSEEEVRSLKETVAQQEDEIYAGEMERRRLHNTIQELKASLPLLPIKVPLHVHKLFFKSNTDYDNKMWMFSLFFGYFWCVLVTFV